jgi:hypothetical protein
MSRHLEQTGNWIAGNTEEEAMTNRNEIPVLSRRQMMKAAAAATGCAMAATVGCGGKAAATPTPPITPTPPNLPVGVFNPTAADLSFLDALEQQGCLYFWEQASPVTGQVLDHAANNLSGQIDPTTTQASIAATGFGLTALCIADQRGYLTSAAI